MAPKLKADYLSELMLFSDVIVVNAGFAVGALHCFCGSIAVPPNSIVSSDLQP